MDWTRAANGAANGYQFPSTSCTVVGTGTDENARMEDLQKHGVGQWRKKE